MPSPRPENLVLKNGSKTRAAVSAPMPQPSSQTTSSTASAGASSRLPNASRNCSDATATATIDTSTRPGLAAQRLRCVQDQIEDHLAQRHGVGLDDGRIRLADRPRVRTPASRATTRVAIRRRAASAIEPEPQLAALRHRRAQQVRHRRHQCREIQRRPLRRRLAGVRQHLVGERRRMLRRLGDPLDARLRWHPVDEFTERQSRAAPDHRQQIVEVVRDAARQDAETLQALDLLDVARQAARSPAPRPSAGHVAGGAEHLDVVLRIGLQRGEAQMDPACAATAADEMSVECNRPMQPDAPAFAEHGGARMPARRAPANRVRRDPRDASRASLRMLPRSTRASGSRRGRCGP